MREAVETLTAEYRDKLEEISDTVQHDRQDIVANDDVYTTFTLYSAGVLNKAQTLEALKIKKLYKYKFKRKGKKSFSFLF